MIILLMPIWCFSQTEGWTSLCNPNLPGVTEVMIDAYGNDEFYSEYLILRVGEQPFNVRNLNIRVINPTNNAFIGSIQVMDNSVNNSALTTLNSAVGTTCTYGTVFRDVFSAPYYGIVPPHTAILLFNNKDSVDLSYLPANAFSSLCGSKVLTAFGTIKTQSPGVSIFRNHPRNGSCGNTGCLRQIQVQFEGNNAPFCQQLTYDIKNLPHLNTSNPPDGYGDGSYIRTGANGILTYGGGNLTGNGVPMPPLSMKCIIPTAPSFGAGFWNVLVYEGTNNYTNFRGFYQAKGLHEPSVNANAGSFEYNSARDGWKPIEAPSEAHPTYGALAAYDGCNVQTDNFSMIAKRHGFPCSEYNLQLVNYDDFIRIRIDANGDGSWEFDKSFNAPSCAADCGTDIWQGTLNSDSNMEIIGYDLSKFFNTHVLFNLKTDNPSPIQILPAVTPSSSCNTTGGSIKLNISGGISPYQISWKGVTSIPNDTANAVNLAAGNYKTIITDSKGCRDSINILVPQLNILKAKAGNDTSFCAGGTAILRGSSNLQNVVYEWSTELGSFISNQPIISVSPSISTKYVLSIKNNSACFATDTVVVKVQDLPYLYFKNPLPDAVCKGLSPVLKVNGAQSYSWSLLPNLNSALTFLSNDSVTINTFNLPTSTYTLRIEGKNAHGCKNNIETSFAIIPSPEVTIQPINDTLCLDGATKELFVSPISGGRFYVEDILGRIIPNAVIDARFYPRTAGVGKFKIHYEVTGNQVCKTNTSIDINVKSCAVCAVADTTKIMIFSCDPSVIGTKTTALQNQKGCDSIVITSISLMKTDTFYVEKKTCQSDKIGQIIQKFSNQNGCDSIVITRTTYTPNNIKFDLSISKSISCAGKNDGTLEIKTIIGGTPQYRMRWSNGDTNMTIKNLRQGMHVVSVTDREGCQTIDSIQLKEPLPLSLIAEVIQPNCFDGTYGTIKINTVNNGTAPYQFTINGQNRTVNLLPFNIQNVPIGRNLVKISDINNCSFDTIIPIKEGRKLEISLGSNVYIALGDSISLGAYVNSPIRYAKWSPHETSCDSCIPTFVKPLKTTTYKLTVKDSAGCQAQDDVTVFVEKQRHVFIPNSFSPNDDGVNDIFLIYADKQVKSIKTFQIYDRWGNRVFEMTDSQPNDLLNGWDGTYLNQPLMPAVFIYYALIEFKDGKKTLFQGEITLVK